jgi:hypothetical protein
MDETEVKKRADRAEKLKQRKEHNETVVKCCLRKIIAVEDKLQFINLIDDIVSCSSKRVHYASISLNLLIRECLVEKKVSEFPDFTDTTFLRQLLVGIDDAKKPDPLIKEFYQNHPDLLCHLPRHQGDRNIYSAAAIKLSTNIKNHLRIHLEKIIKKYLYDCCSLDKEQSIYCQSKIWGFKTKQKDFPENTQKQLESIVSYIREMLSLNDTITKQWIKKDSSLPYILSLFVVVQKELVKKGMPLISVLPLVKLNPKFITIDSSVIFGILKKMNYLNTKENVLGKEIWEGVLSYHKVQGRDKMFTGTIDTDGVSVNIHFWKKKLKVSVDEFKTKNIIDKRVVGVDPGRTNIFSMAEVDGSGDIKTYKLSRRRYYRESGITKSNENTIRWTKHIQKELNLLSKNSPKPVDLDKFNEYLKARKSTEEALWNEYFKKKWREQKLRLYGGKKRVFSNFLNQLGNTDDIVLAYGSAKFDPCGRKELSVPTSRAYKECCFRFETILVDEFRSSKINYKTDKPLELVKRKDKNVVVRGLLWCRSTTENEGKFVDRDINACLNIRRCALEAERPEILQRGKKNEKIYQALGKIISC